MIEFDVDMGYLLEEGELECVVLNDENGGHEPMEFVPKSGSGTCEPIIDPWACDPSKYDAYCGNCRYPIGDGELRPWKYCPDCGFRIGKAVKR